MDPTTAALIGAAIGGGASIIAGTIGPWVKDAIERRSRGRTELRGLIRVELLATIEAMSNLHRARLTIPRKAEFAEIHSSAAVAITRLALVLPKRDHHELQRMLSFALETISGNDNGVIVRTAMQASATILEGWYRGEFRRKQIGDEFTRWIQDLRTTDDEYQSPTKTPQPPTINRS